MSLGMLSLINYIRKYDNVVRVSVKYKQTDDQENLLIWKKCTLSQPNETK